MSSFAEGEGAEESVRELMRWGEEVRSRRVGILKKVVPRSPHFGATGGGSWPTFLSLPANPFVTVPKESPRGKCTRSGGAHALFTQYKSNNNNYNNSNINSNSQGSRGTEGVRGRIT